VATGALLDDADHAKLSAAGGQKSVVLDFRNGAWQSRQETMLFACLRPDGAPAKQTTAHVIWLQYAQGALRGTVTVTLEGNECSQQGATIEIPAVAAHVSEVPPGVELPSSPSDTFRPPAPTAHPR
jgi:serine/threonine protein kinase, bacterial